MKTKIKGVPDTRPGGSPGKKIMGVPDSRGTGEAHKGVPDCRPMGKGK